MPLTPGTHLGAYEIVAAIGAGGMGEVYRARDTKLGRDVAIKTLPDIAAGDPERLARFDREAQLLAAVNHPHIAAIYGIEESPAGKFLVLELVDGESLAQRLDRDGPMPVAEALRIATQIIDALEAAHEKGIIHRDLKPGNIMLTADGQVKVLDFGLARAMESAAPSSVSNSPTLSIAATQAGMILGTAAYMSPEQAKGRVADKRSDVWAFGCVLYEMLTGRRAFEGEDVSDTLAAILRGEPDWSTIPADVPPHVVGILKRCLQRDRRGRIPDISVVRYLLAEPPAVSMPATALGGISRRRRIVLAAAAVLAGAILTALVWLGVTRFRTPQQAPRPSRFVLVPPPTHALVYSPIDRNLTLSPDGNVIVYVGRSTSGQIAAENQLMLRSLNQLEPIAAPGTLGARYPFFSPDSRWVGYFAFGELRKIPVSGGPPVTICRTNGGIRGATWTSSDIIFATNDPTTGLMTVPAAGGEPKPLTKVSAAGEDHHHPSILPGDRHVLFTLYKTGDPEAAEVAIADLATGAHKTLIRGGSNPEFVAPNVLLFAQGGALRAVRFDPARQEVLGEPVAIEHRMLTLTPTGAAAFSVSRSGNLVFMPGTSAGVRRSLVWVTRDGREEPVPIESRIYTAVRVSPDGTHAALEARDADQDIWILDFERKTTSKLTFGSALDAVPVWTHDSKSIIFQSAREGTGNIFRQAADGTGTAERLIRAPLINLPFALAPNGAQLVFGEIRPATGADILVTALDGKTPPRALISTPATETNADLSPDGRWLAYQSNEAAGTPQIFVRPFPDVDNGKWQISTAGGTRPVWAKNGRELFYLDLTLRMKAVPIDTINGFRPGNPVSVIDRSYYYSGIPGRPFDISPDGKRFLMIKDPEADDAGNQPSMVVVLNWIEEVKARLALK